jgi:hypothetical protein
MKSCRIALIALLALLSTGLNAQVFVGGNFNMNLSGGKNDNGTSITDRPSSFSLGLSPKFGKFLSEKAAVGVSLNFAMASSNNHANTETVVNSSSFGVSPFLRYYAIKMSKFSVFGQGSIGFSYASSKTKFGTDVTDGPKTTSFSLSIVPGVAFDLNEKLSLETSINVLGFGLSQNMQKAGNSKETSTNLNLGAGLGNIVNTGNITIGAIYKF